MRLPQLGVAHDGLLPAADALPAIVPSVGEAAEQIAHAAVCRAFAVKGKQHRAVCVRVGEGIGERGLRSQRLLPGAQLRVAKLFSRISRVEVQQQILRGKAGKREHLLPGADLQILREQCAPCKRAAVQHGQKGLRLALAGEEPGFCQRAVIERIEAQRFPVFLAGRLCATCSAGQIGGQEAELQTFGATGQRLLHAGVGFRQITAAQRQFRGLLESGRLHVGVPRGFAVPPGRLGLVPRLLQRPGVMEKRFTVARVAVAQHAAAHGAFKIRQRILRAPLLHEELAHRVVAADVVRIAAEALRRNSPAPAA